MSRDSVDLGLLSLGIESLLSPNPQPITSRIRQVQSPAQGG